MIESYPLYIEPYLLLHLWLHGIIILVTFRLQYEHTLVTPVYYELTVTVTWDYID